MVISTERFSQHSHLGTCFQEMPSTDVRPNIFKSSHDFGQGLSQSKTFGKGLNCLLFILDYLKHVLLKFPPSSQYCKLFLLHVNKV